MANSAIERKVLCIRPANEPTHLSWNYCRARDCLEWGSAGAAKSSSAASAAGASASCPADTGADPTEPGGALPSAASHRAMAGLPGPAQESGRSFWTKAREKVRRHASLQVRSGFLLSYARREVSSVCGRHFRPHYLLECGIQLRHRSSAEQSAGLWA